MDDLRLPKRSQVWPSKAQPWPGVRPLTAVQTVSGFVPLDVPQAEADELILLYNATAGSAWTDSSNWLTSRTVDDWFGISVTAGHVTSIVLTSNNLIGSVAAFQPGVFTRMITWRPRLNAITGDISSWDTSGIITYDIYLTGGGLSGSMSGWDITSSVVFRVYDNALTGNPGVPSTAVEIYRCQDNGMPQANVDSIIQTIYANRASFVFATPDLNVGGTNAAPSGIYQANCPTPTTGKEMLFHLANDPCGEGFNKWTVTFTA